MSSYIFALHFTMERENDDKAVNAANELKCKIEDRFDVKDIFLTFGKIKEKEKE